MMKPFLKAKHWQLFILTFGIPMIFQFVMMGTIITQLTSGSNPNPLLMLNYFKFFPIIMILFIGTQFGWLWSVAIGLQSKVPENVTMKVKKFKIFFFIPTIYLITILVLMSVVMGGFMKGGQLPNPGVILSCLLFIIPLHFFSMFCIFYSLYFVAKTFKTVELQREVRFNDFTGEFFLIWFFPIGIWIVQPKINQMMRE